MSLQFLPKGEHFFEKGELCFGRGCSINIEKDKLFFGRGRSNNFYSSLFPFRLQPHYNFGFYTSDSKSMIWGSQNPSRIERL